MRKGNKSRFKMTLIMLNMKWRWIGDIGIYRWFIWKPIPNYIE